MALRRCWPLWRPDPNGHLLRDVPAAQRLYAIVAADAGARALSRRLHVSRCGAPANHVEHIHPVLFGATDDLVNLRALCRARNLDKGADPPAAA